MRKFRHTKDDCFNENLHGKFWEVKYSLNLFGVDLFAIESVCTRTVVSFLAETRTDIFKFKTDKQFVN